MARRHRRRMGFHNFGALPGDLLRGPNLGIAVGAGLAFGGRWAANKWGTGAIKANADWIGLAAGVLAGVGLTFAGRREAGASALLTSALVGGLAIAERRVKALGPLAGAGFGLVTADQVGQGIEVSGPDGFGMVTAEQTAGYLGDGGNGDENGDGVGAEIDVSGPGGTVAAFGAGPVGYPGY